MDPELIARISPEHRRRLAWFEEHQETLESIWQRFREAEDSR